MAASAVPVTTSTRAQASSSFLSPSDEALKVAVFQRLHPRAYLERFLAENIRPDKRLCDGFRDVHVNAGKPFFIWKEELKGEKTISFPHPLFLKKYGY